MTLKAPVLYISVQEIVCLYKDLGYVLIAFNINNSFHVKEVKYMIVLFKYEREYDGETFQEEHITHIPIPEGKTPLNHDEEDLWWFLALDRCLLAKNLRILEIEYVED